MNVVLALDPTINETPVIAAQSETNSTVEESSDAAMVLRARDGDAMAFETLVERHRNAVFALAFRYLGQREDAWDVAQEAFIKAHRALPKFRGDAEFKTWMYRITANLCKDRFKKRSLPTVAMDLTTVGHLDAATTTNPRKKAEGKELKQAITDAIDCLSEKHRLAFVLREFEDLSYERMAEVMQCSMGTVMSRLHHARKQLRKTLTQLGVMEER